MNAERDANKGATKTEKNGKRECTRAPEFSLIENKNRNKYTVNLQRQRLQRLKNILIAGQWTLAAAAVVRIINER